MANQNITEALATLTPDQQESVYRFIEFLKHKEQAPTSFLAAAEEFMQEHPELLRRLAQ
jgi:ABC-type nitrate/sulfonate/bicarbonate transport system substrate-binding protein